VALQQHDGCHHRRGPFRARSNELVGLRLLDLHEVPRWAARPLFHESHGSDPYCADGDSPKPCFLTAKSTLFSSIRTHKGGGRSFCAAVLFHVPLTGVCHDTATCSLRLRQAKPAALLFCPVPGKHMKESSDDGATRTPLLDMAQSRYPSKNPECLLCIKLSISFVACPCTVSKGTHAGHLCHGTGRRRPETFVAKRLVSASYSVPGYRTKKNKIK
jgi:hypothetical protein